MVLIISSSGGVGPKGKINCMYKRSVWQFYIVTLFHCTLYVHCTMLHCTLLHCTLLHCTLHVHCGLSGNCTLLHCTLYVQAVFLDKTVSQCKGIYQGHKKSALNWKVLKSIYKQSGCAVFWPSLILNQSCWPAQIFRLLFNITCCRFSISRVAAI